MCDRHQRRRNSFNGVILANIYTTNTACTFKLPGWRISERGSSAKTHQCLEEPSMGEYNSHNNYDESYLQQRKLTTWVTWVNRLHTYIYTIARFISNRHVYTFLVRLPTLLKWCWFEIIENTRNIKINVFKELIILVNYLSLNASVFLFLSP